MIGPQAHRTRAQKFQLDGHGRGPELQDEGYHLIYGPDGERDSYRFTILDANVVKEIATLHRSGFSGIEDLPTVGRLRNLLRRRFTLGELYAGVGALELAQPFTTGADGRRFATYVAAVNDLNAMTPAQCLRAYKDGVPLSEMRSPHREGVERGVQQVRVLLPELVGDAAILNHAWQLRDSGEPWQSALSEFERFCNETIRYAPGLAVLIAITFLAASGDASSQLTAVLKYRSGASAAQRNSAVMNAAGDVQFVDSLRRIPTAFRVADGEDIDPVCGITADRGLRVLGALRYGSGLGARGSSFALDTRWFRPERLPHVSATIDALNRGLARRRNSSRQLAADTKFTMAAACSYLDAENGTQWATFAAKVDADPDSWWNSIPN